MCQSFVLHQDIMEAQEMGKRRPNLTGRDVRCLADFVKTNRQGLFGKAGNCVEKIKQRKEDTWALALVFLEAQGLQPGRSAKDLRLTWNELAAKARKYRDMKNKTGGGPPVEVNEKYEAVLEAMVEESVEGVVGPEEEAGLPFPSSQMSQTSENAMAVAMLVNSIAGGVTAVPEQCSTSSTSSGPQPVPGHLGQMDDTVIESSKKPSGMKSYEERLLELEENKLEVEKEKLQVMKRALHVFECFVFNQKEA